MYAIIQACYHVIHPEAIYQLKDSGLKVKSALPVTVVFKVSLDLDS